MASPVRVITWLLPERRRLAGQPLSARVARALAMADQTPLAIGGEMAQLQRHFTLQPDPGPNAWPMAALARQFDSGDAAGAQWLRADFAHVRPDINGVRLMACGSLGLRADEAETLLQALQPLFDSDIALLAGTPQRWYLKLPAGLPVPAFSTPEQALGDDLLAHLPDGPDARRWRSLLNEVQIVLHQHPLNAARAAAGQMTLNSLWFWGAGILPAQVQSHAGVIETDAVELQALAAAADGHADASHRLVDVRDARDLPRLEREHLLPALDALASGRLHRCDLDFADGTGFTLQPRQRWRFWRRPLAAL